MFRHLRVAELLVPIETDDGSFTHVFKGFAGKYCVSPKPLTCPTGNVRRCHQERTEADGHEKIGKVGGQLLDVGPLIIKPSGTLKMPGASSSMRG